MPGTVQKALALSLTRREEDAKAAVRGVCHAVYDLDVVEYGAQ